MGVANEPPSHNLAAIVTLVAQIDKSSSLDGAGAATLLIVRAGAARRAA